jgi:hypothetical protein
MLSVSKPVWVVYITDFENHQGLFPTDHFRACTTFLCYPIKKGIEEFVFEVVFE